MRARTEWPSPSGCSSCSKRRPRGAGARAGALPARPWLRCGWRTCRSPIRPGRASCSTASTWSSPRRDRRPGRRERLGQEHDRGAAARPGGADVGPNHGRRRRPRRLRPRRVAAARSPGCRSGRCCSAAPSPRTSGSAIRSASEERVRRAAILAGADAVARLLPDGYDTVVGDGGRPLSPGSAAGSRSPARSCATRPSSCSTSRRPTSTRRAPRSSARRSSACAPTAPSS